MQAIALTDYHSLSGAVEFYDHCKRIRVQPILGLEISCRAPELATYTNVSRRHLVMLAMDLSGWASLCHLASLSEDAITFTDIAKNHAGLICLESSLTTEQDTQLETNPKDAKSRYLNHLKDLFPGRLYLAIQHHQPRDTPRTIQLANLANRCHIPIVAVHPVRMLHRGDKQIQKTITAIRLNTTIQQIPTGAAATPETFFQSPQQISVQFSHLPGALDAMYEIAERCRFELPVGKPHYPELDLAPDSCHEKILRQQSYAGVLEQYGTITPEIRNRLEHELSVIEQLGYASIFLIMSEIIQYARQRGVPTASRGSASSSLVAHCLGITTPDPIQLNLYFERFLNPARATPPDIDTDLCSRRRDEVIRFIYERFGDDKVAMVCTISRFRARSALREVAKAYGLPPRQVSKLADELPYRWYRIADSSEEKNPFAELAKKYPDQLHQSIFKDAAAIIGIPHHLSIHPGGVVITPGHLTDLVPTSIAPKGIVITQLDLESIERLGLVKFDMLGIRGLTVLGDVAEAISQPTQTFKNAGISHPNPIDVLDEIPEDEPGTRQTIQTARTIGCFQIESPGMRATLREIRAETIDDIMVALALYRPGPLTGGLKDAFVRRHLGIEAATQLHPALTPLLADTYGVILYQEQVLRIAHELAGLSLAEADLLRRAMSHFDPGKQMQTLKVKFIASCLERHAIPEPVGEHIWELMAAFAGYGFPKAHAASYAVVAWRAAWCKTHHPALFMAAVLANWGGYYSQRVYLAEARRLGLKIRSPQINYAQREFSAAYLEGEQILFMGLDQVRDLTRNTITRIIAHRPFNSLNDFLMRVDPRPIEAENLITCGALETFGTIPALLASIKQDRWQQAQLTLFPNESRFDDDWDLGRKAAAQERILGIGVVAHPLELYAQKLSGKPLVSSLEAAGKIGRSVMIAGMRQTWHRSSTDRGEKIYLMELEDMEGTIVVLINSNGYNRFRSELNRGSGPFLIEGVVEQEERSIEPIIRASRIENIAR